ncbi:hypothetical protein CsSME_00016114 [Camellia sinensis var. sinensis]
MEIPDSVLSARVKEPALERPLYDLALPLERSKIGSSVQCKLPEVYIGPRPGGIILWLIVMRPSLGGDNTVTQVTRRVTRLRVDDLASHVTSCARAGFMNSQYFCRSVKLLEECILRSSSAFYTRAVSAQAAFLTLERWSTVYKNSRSVSSALEHHFLRSSETTCYV